MPIVTAELGPFFLVRLTGDLTIDNATDLAANMGKLFTVRDRREFVLDLSKVGKTDAAGIGAVIASAAVARGKGHRIYLFSPAPHVQNQMETQEISGLFPLIENEPDLVSRLPD